jgi:hypothetical protein
MKIKRLILAIAILGSTLGIIAQPASAAPSNIECTASFEPARASQRELGDEVDKNDNGWVCQKPLPGAGNEGQFNIVDDK